MIWKLKSVTPSEHGDFEWHGRARKGFKVLKVCVYPETYDGDRFISLRSTGPAFGLNVDGHFATVEQAKAYAEGLADAWRGIEAVKVRSDPETGMLGSGRTEKEEEAYSYAAANAWANDDRRAGLEDHVRRADEIRAAHFEPLCFALNRDGIHHRDLAAAMLLQAFDLMLAEADDHEATYKVFVYSAEAFGAVRLDQHGVPNPNGQ